MQAPNRKKTGRHSSLAVFFLLRQRVLPPACFFGGNAALLDQYGINRKSAVDFPDIRHFGAVEMQKCICFRAVGYKSIFWPEMNCSFAFGEPFSGEFDEIRMPFCISRELACPTRKNRPGDFTGRFSI
ncbi:MAG: hypothetical protein E7L01_12810 [Paenibacillus macerans]|uniref:hypothetical protein n=1 Tax=Paenibacillus TaxID=44249 RepID=UPI00242C643E|nr:hypothetical protein [Paenibacillus macerans]MBS5913740.1 hypothetical protein [Paenibacillus macerans]MDU5948316.1 hypothetical protein [Paenibacillus macerans]MDU7474197.1 hypothetical protein [Paenibacillus macerans]